MYVFSNKNFFMKIFSCQKNYFENFFRFFRKVKNPSVLRKNFFAPNYNTDDILLSFQKVFFNTSVLFLSLKDIGLFRLLIKKLYIITDL
jgi:hypothetical protein